MTNYQEGDDPRQPMPEGAPPPQGAPGSEAYGGPTTQLPPAQGQPPWDRQQRYEGQGQWGPGYREERHRPHVQIRSTFLTTEFWVFVVVAIGTLIAAAFTDEDELGGLGAHDAWKFVTWLAIGYMVSRGLTKLGGNRRDGGERGTRV